MRGGARMMGEGWVLGRGDPGWPAALEDLASPPERLYGLGDPGSLLGPCLSIVGARRATPYGLAVAEMAAPRRDRVRCHGRLRRCPRLRPRRERRGPRARGQDRHRVGMRGGRRVPLLLAGRLRGRVRAGRSRRLGRAMGRGPQEVGVPQEERHHRGALPRAPRHGSERALRDDVNSRCGGRAWPGRLRSA